MDTITAGNGRALQQRKARSDRKPLALKTRKTFLDHLAATCNVQASAAAAGWSKTTVFYRLRRDDEAFAEAWREAMQIGYDRLEEALLTRALGQLGAIDGDPPAADPDAIAIALVDDRPTAAADAATGAPRAGLQLAAGLPHGGAPDGVARVDVQLALALLNRQAAIARNGPERRAVRVTVEQVEAAVATKLDRLAAQLARQRR